MKSYGEKCILKIDFLIKKGQKDKPSKNMTTIDSIVQLYKSAPYENTPGVQFAIDPVVPWRDRKAETDAFVQKCLAQDEALIRQRKSDMEAWEKTLPKTPRLVFTESPPCPFGPLKLSPFYAFSIYSRIRNH